MEKEHMIFQDKVFPTKYKILFVQEVFGRLSEVFLYRMLTKMNDIDVEV